MTHQGKSPAYERALRRAAIPEICFVPDVSLAINTTEETARRAILRGDLGPYTRIGRRLVLTRESMLAALARRQEMPPEYVHTSPKRKRPPKWAIDAIEGKRPDRSGR